MKTLEQTKQAVQTRHRYLAELGYKIKLGHLYELQAKESGFPDWDTLIALTKSEAELEAEDETVGAYQEQFKTALYGLWEFFPAADLDCIVTDEDLPKLKALEEAIGNLDKVALYEDKIADRVMSPQATSLIAALKSIPVDDETPAYLEAHEAITKEIAAPFRSNVKTITTRLRCLAGIDGYKAANRLIDELDLTTEFKIHHIKICQKCDLGFGEVYGDKGTDSTVCPKCIVRHKILILPKAKELASIACDQPFDITLTISQDMKVTQTKKLNLTLGKLLNYLKDNLPKTAKLDLSDGSIYFYAKRDGSTIRYNVKIDHTPIPTVAWIEVGEKFHEALEEIFTHS